MELSEGRDVALQQGGEDAEPFDGGEDGLGGAGDAGVAQARGVAAAGPSSASASASADGAPALGGCLLRLPLRPRGDPDPHVLRNPIVDRLRVDDDVGDGVLERDGATDGDDDGAARAVEADLKLRFFV